MSATAQAATPSFANTIRLPEEGLHADSAMTTSAAVVAFPQRRRFTAGRTVLFGTAVLFIVGVAVVPKFLQTQPSDISSALLPSPMRIPGASVPSATRSSLARPQSSASTLPRPQAGAPASQVFTDDLARIDEPAALTKTPAPLAVAAPAQPPAPVAPVVAPAPPVARSENPIDTVLKLVPASMTPQQEVQVLGLVTQIATRLREMGEDHRALRDQIAAMNGSFGDRLNDLERRIGFREAQEAVTGMQGGQVRPILAPAPAAPPPTRPTDSSVVWKVQGGSPRMAVLAQETSDAPPRVIKVGQKIDDRLGVVQSIEQIKGRWIVRAERGQLEGGK